MDPRRAPTPPSSSPAPTGWPAFARVPLFLTAPSRSRRDGWSGSRQAAFLGWLAETGSVAAAAQGVGMSRNGAYRLLRRSAGNSFAYAWASVIALRAGRVIPPRKFTPAELQECEWVGPWIVTMRRGRFIRVTRKPSDSAVLRYLRQHPPGPAPGAP